MAGEKAEVVSIARRAQRIHQATIPAEHQAAFWCGHPAPTPGCQQCYKPTRKERKGKAAK